VPVTRRPAVPFPPRGCTPVSLPHSKVSSSGEVVAAPHVLVGKGPGVALLFPFLVPIWRQQLLTPPSSFPAPPPCPFLQRPDNLSVPCTARPTTRALPPRLVPPSPHPPPISPPTSVYSCSLPKRACPPPRPSQRRQQRRNVHPLRQKVQTTLGGQPLRLRNQGMRSSVPRV